LLVARIGRNSAVHPAAIFKLMLRDGIEFNEEVAPVKVPRLILALHVVAGFAFLSPAYIRPDSVAVYAYLRSLFLDRDLLFFNEWAGFGMIGNHFTWFKEVTPVGALANHWWIGTSLLSAPFYSVAAALSGALSMKGDGFFGLYQWTLGWSSVLFACGSLLIAERILTAFAIPLRARLLAVFAAWIGTPLFWYEYRFSLGTHAAGALCVAALVWLLWRATIGEPDMIDGALIGLALGLAIATRLQHFVLIVPLLYAIARGRLWRLFPAIAAGCTLPLAVQAAAWQIIYGNMFGPLLRGANLEGVTWMPFRTIAFVPVLFSSFHGLLPWSPVIALAIAGWMTASREQKPLGKILLLMFVAELVANSTLDRYWWGGMSFGGRRFTDLAAPFAIGIGFLLARWRSTFVYILTTLCLLWSTALTAPAIAGSLSLEHDVTPGSLLTAAASARQLLPPAALHSSLTQLPSLGLATAGLLIVTAVTSFLLICGRRRKWIVTGAVTYLTAALLLTLSASGRTRERAEADRMRFHLAPALASVGPLLDQRKLISDEVVYLQRRGEKGIAAQRLREIAAIDQRLGSTIHP